MYARGSKPRGAGFGYTTPSQSLYFHPAGPIRITSTRSKVDRASIIPAPAVGRTKSFRPIPALALFHNPALKRGPSHPIHFASGHDLKDRCEGGLRQSNRALFLCFH